MNKKKLFIIGIILAVIIITVILISVFVKKKIEIDKEYVLLPEEQFTYYVLNVDDKKYNMDLTARAEELELNIFIDLANSLNK